MWIVLNLKGYTWFSFQWRDIIHMDLIRWIKKTVNPASNFKQFIICTWPYCPFSLCECLHMLAKSFHTFPVQSIWWIVYSWTWGTVLQNVYRCKHNSSHGEYNGHLAWQQCFGDYLYIQTAHSIHIVLLAENIFPHMNSCRTGVGWLSWEAGNQSWTVMTLISRLPSFAGFKLQ